MRAFLAGQPCLIRNPSGIGPWQLAPAWISHARAERLAEDASRFASGWNFGPGEMDASPVSWIADELARSWGNGASWIRDAGLHPPEAHFLKLNASKARGLPGLASSASFEANPRLGRGVVPAFEAGTDLGR
jgi:CDP-glucose 4,6-dehydratase